MIFKIYNRWNNSVMFEVEADSFVRAVEQKRANLSEADLSGANLYGANLYGANLPSIANPPFLQLGRPPR